jgi:hypothetical protein
MGSENGDRELRPRFVLRREATKKVRGDVPESVADDFEQYCRFVAEAAGVKPEEVAGDVLAAAIKEFVKADKAFPQWKKRQLEDVSSDEVEQALSGLGAGAPQGTPRPAGERQSRPAASGSAAGSGQGGGAGKATGEQPTPPPPTRAPASAPAQR